MIRQDAVAMRALYHFENGVLFALLIGMVPVVMLQIFFRYVLHDPLIWSAQVATHMLVWTAFIGMAVGVRDGRHVAVQLINDRFPPSLRRPLDVLHLLLVAIFMAALLWGGLDLLLTQGTTNDLIGFPNWVVYAAMPIGSALGLLHAAVHASRVWKGIPLDRTPGRPMADLERVD